MKLSITLFFLCVSFCLHAATVDTVAVYSAVMKKTRKCVVVKPDTYHKKGRMFPVVYVLHGYGGDYSNWIKKVPEIKALCDLHQVIIVCPDGEVSSWYLDSPIDSTMQYETYIAKEVVQFIDARYKTIKKREARAITGLSMGGHGALLMAYNHADQFGACGSMSGVVDLGQTRVKYELSKRIGDTILHKENWKKVSVINRIESPPSDSLVIIIDCGIADIFITSNRKLHQKMLDLKIPHEYTERPGNHSWSYWGNSISYHLLFFRKFFNGRRE
jgi:S-formylglutathione hydrolase FrmB